MSACYYDACVALPIGGMVIGCNTTKNVGSKKHLTESGGKLLASTPEDVDTECVSDVVSPITPLTNGECRIVGLCTPT